MCEYICDNCGPIEAKTLGDRDTDYCPFCGAGSNEIMPLAEAYRIQIGKIERLTAELERHQSSAEMFADIVKTMGEVATPWMRDDGDGGLTGTIRRMAAELEQAKAALLFCVAGWIN